MKVPVATAFVSAVAELIHRGGRRKHERIDEEAERHAERGAEHAAEEKDDKAAPELPHLPLRLIRRRKPSHRELDAPVGQFAPAFDLGHVGGLG